MSEPWYPKGPGMRDLGAMRKVWLYAKAWWMRWRAGTRAVVTMEPADAQAVAVHAGVWRTSVELKCTGCDRMLIMWLQPLLPPDNGGPCVCVCGKTLIRAWQAKELPK